MTQITDDKLAEAMRDAYPELETVRAATEDPVYLVGGAVRDLLLGRGRSANLDLVVEGDAAALANRLGPEVLEHERFGTATVSLGEPRDRRGSGPAPRPTRTPGALPEVTPAGRSRPTWHGATSRVNAMAMPLTGGGGLIDPHGGREDLESGLLRVLHPGSFGDDPTRALRAARYAARFGFALEPRTAALLRETDLGAVSADRREAELLRLASEATAVRGFELLAEWGLVSAAPRGARAGRPRDRAARPARLGWDRRAPGARAASGRRTAPARLPSASWRPPSRAGPRRAWRWPADATRPS